MSRTIWKYPLPAKYYGDFELELPDGAVFLSLQVQRGVPCLWAMVDPSAPKVRETFKWLLTGDEVPTGTDWGYVGLVQLHDGGLVVHLWRMFR